MIIKPGMLRRMRILAGLSQRELSRLSGVSQSEISQIEAGRKSPTYRTLEKLSAVLGKSGAQRRARELMTSPMRFCSPGASIKSVKARFRKYNISQMPVVDGGRVVGAIRESDIIAKPEARTAEEAMGQPFPSVPEDMGEEAIRQMLRFDNAVVVTRNGKPVGIITKSDLI